MKNKPWFVACCLVLWLDHSVAAYSAEPAFSEVKERFVLQSAEMKEASGVAISSVSNGFMWVIADSGNPPEIHLFGTNGTNHGKLRLMNAKNMDWEGIASFSIDGVSYLLVADTGDNNAVREKCTLYVLREPKLPKEGEKLTGTVELAWRMDFTFEGGPRDCESVAVDEIQKKILLVSKRTTPPEVHELPLMPQPKNKKLVTRKIGEIRVPSPEGTLIQFCDQPTGFDISADHSLAAVVTYYSVFLFSRHDPESWSEALAKKPVVLSPHGLNQAESVAISKDGTNVIVLSEGIGTPIMTYPRGSLKMKD
ncbi:MAG: hypothetical protein H8M99_11765 [Gloeobacteraceae cyanobacterium ES-bin-144]|nr:hypothetical protein [Verrucomicrobiales bacterium]